MEQKLIQDMLQGACFQFQIWKSVYSVSCVADQLSSHRKISEASSEISICSGKSNITCFPKWGWWNHCDGQSGQCWKWEQFQSLTFQVWLFLPTGFIAQGVWHFSATQRQKAKLTPYKGCRQNILRKPDLHNTQTGATFTLVKISALVTDFGPSLHSCT